MTNNHISTIYIIKYTSYTIPRWGKGFKEIAKRELFLWTPEFNIVTTPGISWLVIKALYKILMKKDIVQWNSHHQNIALQKKNIHPIVYL